MQVSCMLYFIKCKGPSCWFYIQVNQRIFLCNFFMQLSPERNRQKWYWSKRKSVYFQFWGKCKNISIRLCCGLNFGYFMLLFLPSSMMTTASPGSIYWTSGFICWKLTWRSSKFEMYQNENLFSRLLVTVCFCYRQSAPMCPILGK